MFIRPDAALILRDAEGAYYLLTGAQLDQARATADEQSALEADLGQGDTAGYIDGLVGLGGIGGFSIVSPRDPASGLPTGKRQHGALVITKELD